jgi:hypothetical protein
MNPAQNIIFPRNTCFLIDAPEFIQPSFGSDLQFGIFQSPPPFWPGRVPAIPIPADFYSSYALPFRLVKKRVKTTLFSHYYFTC